MWPDVKSVVTSVFESWRERRMCVCHNPGVNMILAQAACRTADGGSPGHRGLGAIVNVRTITILPKWNSLLTLITQRNGITHLA